MNYDSLMKLKKAQLVEKVVGLQNDVAQLNAKLNARKAPKSGEIALPKDYWNDAFAELMVKRKSDPDYVFKWLKFRNWEVKIDGKLRHLHGRRVRDKMISLNPTN